MGIAEFIIGRTFARPVGSTHATRFKSSFCVRSYEFDLRRTGRCRLRPAAKNNARIDAAETEAVRDGMRDGNVSGFAADQIDAISETIRIFEIESRRSDLVAKRKHRENRFQAASGSQQMPGGRFCRADRDSSIPAEDGLDRCEFAAVSNRRRGGMGIQVLDIAWRDASLLQRQLHRAGSTFAIFGSRCHVVGVGRRAVSDDLGDRSGLSGQGMLQFLDHENSSTLTHDKAIAVAVERAGRAGRGIVEIG
jgi:hypothetical protein